MYQRGKGNEEQSDTLDPGLVQTGTKCGENAVGTDRLNNSNINLSELSIYYINFLLHFLYKQLCFEGECRNASFLQTDECSAKCHGHGVSSYCLFICRGG